MDQEKIGKYIRSKRKEKNITQQELASRLGVSEKTVSNWENGRNMPDLSLFNPLCEELNISINDLMNGEKVDNNNYQKKLEENLVNTINYSNKKTNNKIGKICILFIILFITLFITFLLFVLFNKNNIEPDTYPIYNKVYLDKQVLEPVLKNHILDNILLGEFKDEHEELKNFASFKIFSTEQKSNNNYYIYTWVLELSYIYSNGCLTEERWSFISM